MNQSEVATKIYSILQNEPQVNIAESINNYIQYRSETITPDLLKMLWDRSIDGMMLTDSDGNITAINNTLAIMVNMKQEDLIGLPLTVMYGHSADRDQILDKYIEQVRIGKFGGRIEKSILLNTGKNITVEITTTQLVDDAQEMFVLTEFRDIGERMHREQLLSESEQQYRTLFENSVLPMYRSNVNGKFLNANCALLKLLGYDSFDELQRLDLETDVYARPEQRTLLFENLKAGTNTKPAELELKKKDGSKISVLAHSRAIKNDLGSITGFEGALENVTEERELDRQLKANIKKLESTREELTKLNAQKDKILAIVSHDLRSPFGSILGFCDLLKNEFSTLSDTEKLEYVAFINDAALQQLNLVNSILDWSRLETGKFRLKIRSVDVGVISSEVATSLLGLAKKKNIVLRSVIPSGTHIDADEQLVRQMLLNLVGNALKFTPSGGLISLELREDSADQTVLVVSDSGIGIPPEDLSKLFKVEEKYSRLGLQGEVGTGLGLPMCYEIMKRHNGSIEAVSEPSQGTSFIVAFRKLVRSECKRVLIVDDQKGNRMILSRFMKRISQDSETVFAETGKEALELMNTHIPDLIITDYHMPTMNGLEFIHMIREDNRFKHTPVILISGDNMEYYVQSDGLIKILQKPVMFNKLKEVVEKLKF